MRYLILSDIHANREALEAVIENASGGYDKLVCCGDLVGYGADPRWVIDWTRKSVQSIVRGNHDKACAGLDDLEWFNPSARASAIWTHETLEVSDIEYLAELPKGPLLVEGFSLIHGSPVDEDEYLIQTRDAADIKDYLEAPVTFFGHTHLQGGFQLHRNGVRAVHPVDPHETSVSLQLEEDSYHLINPGSVGQPRDGDPRAAYVLFDSESRVVEYRRVEYDVASAQQKIRSAGLPRSLADRLARGS